MYHVIFQCFCWTNNNHGGILWKFCLPKGKCLICADNKHEHNKIAGLPRASRSGCKKIITIHNGTDTIQLVIVWFVSKVFGKDPFAQGTALKRIILCVSQIGAVWSGIIASWTRIHEKINSVFVHTVQRRPGADGE